MNHIRQGYNDCILATIAMLANTDLETVHQTASKLAGSTSLTEFNWMDELNKRSTDQAIQYATAVAHEVGLKMTIFTRSAYMTATGFNPDLSGKGQISIRIEGFYESGHSMAYANGLVYDPSYDSPVGETWTAFLARLRLNNKEVTKVVVNPLKNEGR